MEHISLTKLLQSACPRPVVPSASVQKKPFEWVVHSVSFFFARKVSTLGICCFVGNYGNQLDVSVPPSSSSTSPTNAIFDGSFYYFLPWNDIKPCCNVDSHWEDIAFRLEPLNILTRMCEQLVSTCREKKKSTSVKMNLMS